MRDSTLLILTDATADDLAMRMASSQLLGAWGDVALEFTQSGEADVTGYAAAYRLQDCGALIFQSGQAAPHKAASFSYTTVIARPDNFSTLLRMQRRAQPGAAVVDGLRLGAQKNEWIEAGFAASQLAAHAPCPALRTLVLLPGKNYQLEEDTELFEAVLHNGCRVLASDLRCYYLLRAEICWEQSNFTLRQLDEVAKLPAPLTPLYVHGNGDVTLSSAYEAGVRGTLRHREQGVTLGDEARLEQDTQHSGKGGFSRLVAVGARAIALLGQPQPGDALTLARTRALQAA